MATPRASGDDCATAVDAAAALRWMVAVAGKLFGDLVMDWQQVMARADWTVEEKRAMYVARCREGGLAPYPEVYREAKTRKSAR